MPGAKVVDGQSVWKSDLVIKVQPPSTGEIILLENRAILSYIYPAQHEDKLKMFAQQNSTAFAMDCIPRMLSRGQAFDALSSQVNECMPQFLPRDDMLFLLKTIDTQANIAGYRAVIEAANEFGRFFTGQMTAAGRVPPAKVLVLGKPSCSLPSTDTHDCSIADEYHVTGAGVAGLSAIGVARSMGAMVSAYDVRPVAREQVESLGGTFLSVNVIEDGSGAGGYAKEMSSEYKAAEVRNQEMSSHSHSLFLSLHRHIEPFSYCGRKWDGKTDAYSFVK